MTNKYTIAFLLILISHIRVFILLLFAFHFWFWVRARKRKINKADTKRIDASRCLLMKQIQTQLNYLHPSVCIKGGEKTQSRTNGRVLSKGIKVSGTRTADS